jgi:hypothetical protein
MSDLAIGAVVAGLALVLPAVLLVRHRKETARRAAIVSLCAARGAQVAVGITSIEGHWGSYPVRLAWKGEAPWTEVKLELTCAPSHELELQARDPTGASHAEAGTAFVIRGQRSHGVRGLLDVAIRTRLLGARCDKLLLSGQCLTFVRHGWLSEPAQVVELFDLLGTLAVSIDALPAPQPG